MPLPITHIIFLQKFWQQTSRAPELFSASVLGTLLPDINYLNEVSRDKTHFLWVRERKVEDLFNSLFVELSRFFKGEVIISDWRRAFIDGYCFHLILDKWWAQQVKPIRHSQQYLKYGYSLKLLSEDLLKKNSAKLYLDFNLDLSFFPSFFGLKVETVEGWYIQLNKYLQLVSISERLNFLADARAISFGQIIEVENEINIIEKGLMNLRHLENLLLDFYWLRVKNDHFSL